MRFGDGPVPRRRDHDVRSLLQQPRCQLSGSDRAYPRGDSRHGPFGLPGPLPSDLSLSTLLGLVMGEVAFGMMLGLVASFIFAGLQLAGQIVSFQLGFSIVNLIDPQSEVETSVFSFLYYYLGILLFLLINGHHWFFLAVSDSFNYLPVQGVTLHAPVIHDLIRLSSQMFVSGLQIAAPVLAVTVITDIVLGILGRAAPQIHILIVGLPLKSLVGFAA